MTALDALKRLAWVKAGEYYAGRNGDYILYVYSLDVLGNSYFHRYNVYDGSYKNGSCCDTVTLLRWVDRKATPEEISRLHGMRIRTSELLNKKPIERVS